MKNPELHTEQWQPVRRGISKEALVVILTLAGLPLQDWDQGTAKTIEHLRTEIAEGESQIVISKTGEVRRQAGVARIDVIHPAASGELYILKEDRQEFADGRVRKRQLSTSLGEKMKPHEEPIAAAERAISEELGINEIVGLYNLGAEEIVHVSESYPGLKSYLKTHLFAAIISPESFVPEGYIEEQDDKKNYYVWDSVETNKSS